jgi:uncharacterized membrane protein YcaP (DUF421 family)
MEAYSFDLSRMFLGDMPFLFYAEIALRTTILYTYTLAIVRFLGKRSAGELTVLDVVIIVALGSAVGDPMFYPDIPVLQGLLVITLVVGLQRVALHWANRNAKVDRLLKGRPSLVVSNGVLNLDGLEHIGISKREIFQMARQSGYRNLGEIRRMYIETDDKPSIYGFDPDQIRPGLPFEPPWEIDQHATIQVGSIFKQQTIAACVNCGQTAEFREGEEVSPCLRCQHTNWSSVG